MQHLRAKVNNGKVSSSEYFRIESESRDLSIKMSTMLVEFMNENVVKNIDRNLMFRYRINMMMKNLLKKTLAYAEVEYTDSDSSDDDSGDSGPG